MITPADAMRSRLRADLSAAMAGRDRAAARLLRALVAAIDNAEAVPVEPRGPYREKAFGDPSTEVPRRNLDHDAVRAVIEADAAERESAAARYRAAGHPDRAIELEGEAAIVRRYSAG